VQPYLSGGIAASFNQAQHFNTEPLGLVAPYTPYYSDDTYVGFAFSLGIGIQKTFYTNWQVGVGYEFNSLGKAFLGIDHNYPYYTSGQGLRLTNWYAHLIQFSLSYSY
jgi:opacity protein-like surface antigen